MSSIFSVHLLDRKGKYWTIQFRTLLKTDKLAVLTLSLMVLTVSLSMVGWIITGPIRALGDCVSNAHQSSVTQFYNVLHHSQHYIQPINFNLLTAQPRCFCSHQYLLPKMFSQSAMWGVYDCFLTSLCIFFEASCLSFTSELTALWAPSLKNKIEGRG